MDGAENSAKVLPLNEAIDLLDFAQRWKRARLSALKKYITANKTTISQLSDDELNLLQDAQSADLSELLKLTYYNSRKLGLSALSHYNLIWELSDVPRVLNQSQVPCFSGQWSDDGSDQKTLTRGACEAFKRCGSKACDFFREAIDGLLIGVGDEVRHVRHASIGHGDKSCIDVFFERRTAEPRYLPIPTDIMNVLQPIKAKLESEYSALEISLKGYAEGTVYCEVKLGRKGCSAGAEEAEVSIKLLNMVRQELPALHIRNAAPTSVFDKVLGTVAENTNGDSKRWNRIVV